MGENLRKLKGSQMHPAHLIRLNFLFIFSGCTSQRPHIGPTSALGHCGSRTFWEYDSGLAYFPDHLFSSRLDKLKEFQNFFIYSTANLAFKDSIHQSSRCTTGTQLRHLSSSIWAGSPPLRRPLSGRMTSIWRWSTFFISLNLPITFWYPVFFSFWGASWIAFNYVEFKMANKPSVSVTLLQVVTGDGTRVPAILLANKCDLRDESTVSLKMLSSPLYHLPLNVFIVFFYRSFFS